MSISDYFFYPDSCIIDDSIILIGGITFVKIPLKYREFIE